MGWFHCLWDVGLGFLSHDLKQSPPCLPASDPRKNLVAILHLLVALAMHFRAPIHLPEHASVQVVVVRVSIASLAVRLPVTPPQRP